MASFVPFGIILVLGDNFDIQNTFHMGSYKIALFAPFLNFMANPLIYLISIASFREFLVKKVLHIKGWNADRDCNSVSRELSASRMSSQNVLSSLRRTNALRQSSVISTDILKQSSMISTDVLQGSVVSTDVLKTDV